MARTDPSYIMIPRTSCSLCQGAARRSLESPGDGSVFLHADYQTSTDSVVAPIGSLSSTGCLGVRVLWEIER